MRRANLLFTASRAIHALASPLDGFAWKLSSASNRIVTRETEAFLARRAAAREAR